MRASLNAAFTPDAVAPPGDEALAFHRSLPGYAPTPLRPLGALAAELGLGAVCVKDESDRLGLPAFKVVGASWAVERALAAAPEAHTLVAASAGNHGRAVARVAALRRLRCRIHLPARSVRRRREAIAAEGAEVVVADGTYEDAVALAHVEGAADGVLEIADVGDSDPARWVIDGYATLFAEIDGAAAEPFDVLLVPVGVGSLAAAAARFGAASGTLVVGVEPSSAACLAASLEAGEPVTIPTPGTVMAGLDCAEVSTAAWPSLRDGIHSTVTVDDDEVAGAVHELSAAGLSIGESGAAPLAALRTLMTDAGCSALRSALRLGPGSRVVLIATEGPTG